MKRKIALFMTIVMLITVIVPSLSFAENVNYKGYDEELKSAIIKAKELFDITEDYDKFTYNVNSYNDKIQFSLNWSASDQKLGNIRVTIDSNGQVISYNKYQPYYGGYKPKLAKISRSEAEEIAREFIEKINPEYLNKIIYKEDNRPLNVNDRDYSINYTRVENGVPYYNNSLRVSVDNMTGQIKSFYSTWNKNIEFPDLKEILDIEEAKSIYKEDVGLQLVYKFSYKNNEIRPYLVFNTLKNKNIIDAKTGEVTNENYYVMYDRNGLAKMEDTSLTNESVKLTPAEKDAIDNMSGILTEEEAQNVAREKLNIEDKYNMTYIRLYSQWGNKGEYIWSMRFESKDDENTTSSVSISIDAKTGEMQNFSKYEPYDKDAEVVYNKEESKKLADDFIKEMQPEKSEKVEYITWNEPEVQPLNEKEQPRQYSFNYMRKANGAYVDGDGFRITINTVTGQITNYSFKWYKKELPSTGNVIDIEKAYNVLFNDIGIELKYIPDTSSTDEIRPQPYEQSNKVKLVYAIKSGKPLNISGNTGEILDYNGEVYKEETIIKYSDTNDSYAKSQIEVLAQYGVALPIDKFYPNKQINQKDFLYLLAKANNIYIRESYSDDKSFEDALYERLISSGIVKENEKSPQATLTREEAVKYVIRVLNYEEVAQIKGIYVVNFKDADKINPELKGHIAIANGLNIIKGYNGYFNPENELTREQTTLVIYNLLNINK